MIEIEKIIPGGQALGTCDDGRKIFFWGALPGEKVTEYQITKQKSHYLEAIATKINSPSIHRNQPQDECHLSTSPWQIIDYSYELKLKQELVQEIFRKHHIYINPPRIYTDNKDYFYRNKMEYSLYWDHESNKIFPAFHQRGSHRKIPITKSSIERPELFAEATRIINDLNARHEEARKYQSLLLRCNQSGKVSGGLCENHQPHPVFKPLTDTILGYTYSYSPNGFFQINLPVYEMALTEIKKHISTDKVLDLYAGVGTIGLSVARDRHLTLVEVDNFAFNEMKKNIMNISGVKQSEYITIEGLPEAAAEDERPSPVKTGARDATRNSNILGLLSRSEDIYDFINFDQTVILDPPRAGCDKKLINKLLDAQPAKIIYLSCNPVTQARDITLLLERYHIDEVKAFNFFPHTPHIENLVILSL